MITLKELEKIKYSEDFYSFVEENMGLKLNNDQIYKFLPTFEENRFAIIEKKRQVGASTFIAIYSLWKSLTNDNERTLLVSPTTHMSSFIMDIVRKIYSNMHIKMNCSRNNKETICFDNGSEIRSLIPRQCIGYSAKNIIIDEAFMISQLEDAYLALFPCITYYGNKGKFFFVSTCGEKNTFLEKLKQNKDFYYIGV